MDYVHSLEGDHQYLSHHKVGNVDALADAR
jgi:hypothetical protein